MTDQALRNIKLYTWIRVLMKRPYLPILGIYFVNVSGLSLVELGVLMAFSSFVQIILEVPTGYFSDKVSRKYSFLFGSLSVILSVLIWSFAQNKLGVYLGSVFQVLGYALYSGTGQALLHDSLEYLGKDKDYVNVDSKAQSVSLFLNSIIIALVTATYAIDVRLPFLIGALQYLVLFGLSLFLGDIKTKHEYTNDISLRSIRFEWIKKHSSFLVFGMVYGAFAASYTSSDKFNNLALEAYGIDASTLGIYFSIASLTAAFVGIFVYKLSSLSLSKFLLLDIFISLLATVLFATANPVLAVAGFVVSMSFWRYRGIIYQDKILQKYPTKLKATLISSIVNSEQINYMWQALVLGFVFGALGYARGYLLWSIGIVGIGILFYVITKKQLSSQV